MQTEILLPAFFLLTTFASFAILGYRYLTLEARTGREEQRGR